MKKMYCQRLGTKFIGKTAPRVLSDFESYTMISLKDRFHVFLQMHFSSVFVKLKGSVSFRFEVQYGWSAITVHFYLYLVEKR